MVFFYSDKDLSFLDNRRRLPVEIAINGDMWGENNRKIIKTISICCIVVSIMTYIVFTFDTERKYIKAPDYL